MISVVLMIENVAEEVTPEQIQSLFSPFGTIVSCRLYKQGIVQLSYTSRSSAERALNVGFIPLVCDQAMNAFSLKGKKLLVSFEEQFRSKAVKREPVQQAAVTVGFSACNVTKQAIGFVDYGRNRAEKQNDAVSKVDLGISIQ